MTSHTIDDLLRIMAALRDPQTGCPWDVQQDFATIAPYTIEEAYEVADAIDRRDYPDLRDELGDLLLQVVFHARMAEESGHFRFADVVDAICNKMIRRHPHVFPDADGNLQAVDGAEQQTAVWEALKTAERAASGKTVDASALAGIPRGLPEWQRALKLQKRAASDRLRLAHARAGAGQAARRTRRGQARARPRRRCGARGRRGRRCALRCRQSGAPGRRRLFRRAARRQCQVRAALPAHGGDGGRRRHGARRARSCRAGRLLAPGQGRRQGRP